MILNVQKKKKDFTSQLLKIITLNPTLIETRQSYYLSHVNMHIKNKKWHVIKKSMSTRHVRLKFILMEKNIKLPIA